MKRKSGVRVPDQVDPVETVDRAVPGEIRTWGQGRRHEIHVVAIDVAVAVEVGGGHRVRAARGAGLDDVEIEGVDEHVAVEIAGGITGVGDALIQQVQVIAVPIAVAIDVPHARAGSQVAHQEGQVVLADLAVEVDVARAEGPDAASVGVGHHQDVGVAHVVVLDDVGDLALGLGEGGRGGGERRARESGQRPLLHFPFLQCVVRLRRPTGGHAWPRLVRARYPRLALPLTREEGCD